jgi:hypothetical protein
MVVRDTIFEVRHSLFTGKKMSLYKTAAVIALCVTAAVSAVAWYAGMFDRLEMTREPRGPFNLVYREYRGSYRGIRVVMNNVYLYVRDSLRLSTDRGFAVFYDNPQVGNPDSLRSISGIIVDSTAAVGLPYKSGVFDRTDAVVGRFRLRSFFSYTTGGHKFYSTLQRFLAERKIEQTGPVVEIYDMAERIIFYIAPVQRTTSPLPEFSGS